MSGKKVVKKLSEQNDKARVVSQLEMRQKVEAELKVCGHSIEAYSKFRDEYRNLNPEEIFGSFYHHVEMNTKISDDIKKLRLELLSAISRAESAEKRSAILAPMLRQQTSLTAQALSL